MSDQDLIREFKNGSHRAFNEFYDKYKDSIYTFIRYRAGESRCDDLFQETFMKFTDAAQSREIRNPKSYLFTIAINNIRNTYRKKNVDYVEYEDNIEDQDSQSIEDGFFGNADKERLMHSLSRLAKTKPEYYDILHLKFFEDMTFREIGEIKNISINTASSRYKYAISNLKKIAGGYHG